MEAVFTEHARSVKSWTNSAASSQTQANWNLVSCLRNTERPCRMLGVFVQVGRFCIFNLP